MNQVSDPVTLVYHELRAPLGLVATAARSAADECGADDVIRQRCETIVRAAERMLRTANQVFAIAHAARETDRESFQPVPLLQETIQDLQVMGVNVVLEGAGAVDGAEAYGSPSQFEALVHSLLMNANDHCEPGTEIVVRVAVESAAVRVEFWNERGLLKRHRGLGLGLYICEQLAEQLQARLDSSCEGGLFRVSIALPAHIA